MAIANGLCGRDELRSTMGVDDAIDDATIEFAISATSRMFESYCHRVFFDSGAATARVFYADTRGMLRVDDFSTLTGLVVKTDDNDDGTFETTWTISTDFQVEPLNGVVDQRGGFPYTRIRALGPRLFPSTVRPTAEVTARWGWAAIPAELKQAALIQSSRLFRRKDSPFGVAGSGDFGVIRLQAKLDPDVALLLSPFVKTVVV